MNYFLFSQFYKKRRKNSDFIYQKEDELKPSFVQSKQWLSYGIRCLLICLIVAVSCGDLIANTTDIQFMCYEDSRDFGSVCWARCKYGYILRNDKQEDEQEAELSALVDQAQTLLDNAMVIQ